MKTLLALLAIMLIAGSAAADTTIKGPVTYGSGFDIAGANVKSTKLSLTPTTAATTALAITDALGLPPSATVIPALQIVTTSLGDGATFRGGTGIYIQTRDDPSVAGGTKGVLYGLNVDVRPALDRNNSPFDDVAGINIANLGAGIGTSAVSIQQNVSGPPRQWLAQIELGANATYGIFFDPGTTQTYGIDFRSGTFISSPIRLGNNTGIFFRNFADGGDRFLISSDASDNVRLFQPLISSGALNQFGTTTPTHIGSAQTTAPALTSCGGGSPTNLAGTDTAGTVVMGTTATGCVITFNVAYTNAPHCVVTWRATPLATQSYAVTNASITLVQTSTSGNVVDYLCIAPAGG